MIPSIAFKPNKEQRLLDGGLWVFRNEIDLDQKDYAPGSLVRLCTAKGRPLALGFINTRSTIAVRVLARQGEFPEAAGLRDMLRARLEQSIGRRHRLLPGLADLRLVFGEADLLPGLVVDRYGEALVLQIGSLGMDQQRDFLLETLRALVPEARVIVERSEGQSREKEGLVPASGVIWKAPGFDESGLAHWGLQEDGMRLEADLLGGHKTGFYLDQRDTRRIVRGLARDLDCLNAFCYSGAFSVALGLGGAARVTGLDSSAAALDMARRNAALNGLQDRCLFEEADVFKKLREYEKEGRTFGLVLLDPPSMGKGREHLEDALRGYKELNYRSLKLLKPGGLLATCSCTQAVDGDRFLKVLESAARDAACHLRLVARGGQPADHPVLLGNPETSYLKALVLEKAG